MNNPFFVTLSEGAKEKANELGVELIQVDAGDDSAKQSSDIEDLISKNIKVLIVNPADSDAVAAGLEMLCKGLRKANSKICVLQFHCDFRSLLLASLNGT